MKKLNKKYDLSIGMIVKNEEKYLEDCLKALIPLKDEISCEIIVTDTGSTDKTVEIAQKYADQVLHFEWCDDFSAARNTGVQASNCMWFMFVDADEIFDDSVMEIAEFIKSYRKSDVDNASTISRNVHDVNKPDSNADFILKRLFNFNKGKRFFVDKIHEYIASSDNTIKIDSVSMHYGYLAEVVASKKQRNLILLEQEYEEKSNDFRFIKHLLESSDNDKRVEIANKAFDLFENNGNIKNSDYVFSIYCSLCYGFFKGDLKRYDLLIEFAERFETDKKISKFKPYDNLPRLEMLFMYAFACYMEKKYELASIKFIEFIKVYSNLIKKPDQKFVNNHVFNYNTFDYFNRSYMLLIECYKILDDKEGIVNVLKEYPIYAYSNNSNSSSFFRLYTMNAIYCEDSSIITNLIDDLGLKENEIWERYKILFYAKLCLSMDISYYLKNISYNDLIGCLVNMIFTADDNILDGLYKAFKTKTEYSSLIEFKVYLNVIEIYLLKIIKSSNNENCKLNEIFEIYIENVYFYVKKAYNDVVFVDDNITLLLSSETFACTVYPALLNKNENHDEYLKVLKDSLKYYDQFKEIVLFVTEYQRSIRDNLNNPVEENSEFHLLGEKIKSTIRDAIKSNELQKAEFILEQYKSINPSDPEIISLTDFLNKHN